MKKVIIFFHLAVASICFTAQGVSHRLIGANVLDIGNEWHYTTTYTIEDNIPVNYSVTEIERVTGTKTVGSYNAKIVSTTESGETTYEYFYLGSNYMLYLGYDSNIDGYSCHVEYTNNNPLEYCPVWVDESYNNYHYGNGNFTLSIPEIPITWSETWDTRITFLRTETVTVPAGTFECVVVFIRADIDDSLGMDGYEEKTLFMYPEVGFVKSETYMSIRDPSDGVYYVTEYSSELTSSNLIVYLPSIGKEVSEIDFGNASDLASIYIWNDGWETLNYNVSIIEGGSYFSISPPTSGSSTGSYDINKHIVVLNRDNIDPGQTVSGRIMISSPDADNSPQYIDLYAEDMFPDLSGDWIINFEDFVILANSWMEQSCTAPDWCHGGDFNKNGMVDLEDLLILCEDWLIETIIPPIAHWPMDENANNTLVADISGNGNDGTAQRNTSSLNVTGMIGGALSFNGTSDKVIVPDSSDWDICASLSDDWTIDLWVYPAKENPVSNEMFITHYESPTKYWTIRRNNSNKYLRFIAYDGTNMISIMGSTEITSEEWHHIAVVKESEYYAIYLDGVQENYVLTTYTPTVNGPLYIGSFNQTSNLFSGYIDEVRISKANIFGANPTDPEDTIDLPDDIGDY